MQLSSRFASRSPVLRADHPLSDDQIRTVAPSIFAEDKHASRSDRYSYIATGAVLSELRKEGFQPFMVCQTRVRDEPQGALSNCVRTCLSNSKYAPKAQHGWTIKWWATRKNCRHGASGPRCGMHCRAESVSSSSRAWPSGAARA